MSNRVTRVIDPIESEKRRELCLFMRKPSKSRDAMKRTRDENFSSDEEELMRNLQASSICGNLMFRPDQKKKGTTQKKARTLIAIQKFREREQKLNDQEKMMNKKMKNKEQDEDPLKGFTTLGIKNQISFE